MVRKLVTRSSVSELNYVEEYPEYLLGGNVDVDKIALLRKVCLKVFTMYILPQMKVKLKEKTNM